MAVPVAGGVDSFLQDRAKWEASGSGVLSDSRVGRIFFFVSKRPKALGKNEVELLRSLRTQFGDDARRLKHEAIRELSTRRLDQPRIVRTYHDVLLFIAAHPDDDEIARAVKTELKRIAGSIAQWPSSRRNILIDSAIAGTIVETSFSYELAHVLAKRFGDAIDIAWDRDGSAGKPLDEALQWCIGAMEGVGLLDVGLSTKQWMELSGLRGAHAIAWIVERLRENCSNRTMRDQVFENIDLSLRWKLSADGPSRTLTRMPTATSIYQKTQLQKNVNLNRLMREPLPGLMPLPARAAGKMIEAAQNILAVRGRETDPVTNASEREIYHVPTGRGFDVNLFGMKPEARLPLESFIGYVAARNGVPMSYGGAWIFYDQAAIGINIFDEFRGGESAMLFTQIMRVYHQCCGVRVFHVDPFQFGADNDEGLRSGAFWFYYRLGYRPDDAELKALARDEWEYIVADRNYRSPMRVLKKLATKRVVLQMKGAKLSDTPDQMRLGLAVTARVGDTFDGDRNAAQKHAMKRIAALIGKNGSQYANDKRLCFQQMCLAVDTIEDLESWSSAERKQLAEVVISRGGEREIDYLHALRRSDRLRRAWLNVDRAMKRRMRALENV